MKFTIVVHDSGDRHSLKFVRAALSAGHQVPFIFFYHDAVHVADRRLDSSQRVDWQALKVNHEIELAVCIGAASRRGLLDETQPNAINRKVAEHFEVVGLGQLIGAMANSDRLVTFAA